MMVLVRSDTTFFLGDEDVGIDAVGGFFHPDFFKAPPRSTEAHSAVPKLRAGLPASGSTYLPRLPVV